MLFQSAVLEEQTDMLQKKKGNVKHTHTVRKVRSCNFWIQMLTEKWKDKWVFERGMRASDCSDNPRKTTIFYGLTSTES